MAGPLVKNGFSYTDAVLDALETSLSPERMATYMTASGGDREKAARLYTWNTAVSSAFYSPLQGLEVALRNAMHRELSARYAIDWYDNPACHFDSGTLVRVDAAKDELRRNKSPVDPPRMVAALSFGFWVSLLGPGGRLPQGSGKADYETTLWRPCLYRAFPHVRVGRRAVHQPLDYLRTFRNRIAHHEPIFTRHLAKDYESILTITGWISPEMRKWISHHSRVDQLLQSPADDAGLTF